MIGHRVFFKHFSMMRHNRETKVTLVSLRRNPHLVQLDNLSPIWAKIIHFYTSILYLLSQNFEILQYDGIQHFDQSNVSLPQKFPSRQGQLI